MTIVPRFVAGHPTSPDSSRAGRRVLLGALLFVLAAREAAAYADPGSGALLWQLLVAGFVGCLYYFRRFVGRLRSGKGDTKE